MANKGIPGTWEAVLVSGYWVVRDDDGQVVATVGETGGAEATARLIAASPYMLEALKATVTLEESELEAENGAVGASAAGRRGYFG